MISFNARNDHDRCKFVEDIREAILECDEMNNLRIENELDRHRNVYNNRLVFTFCMHKPCVKNIFYCRSVNSSTENRDSGVSDVDLGPLPPYPVKNNKQLLEVSFENSSSQQVTPKRPALTVS